MKNDIGVDARIIKTKAKLVAVFRRLLSEKSFEDITVNEICELADVRRATFYKHYPDKFAFLAYFIEKLRYEFDESFDRAENHDGSVEYYTKFVRAIINFIDANEDMVKNALESDLLPVLANMIMRKNYELTLLRLDEDKAVHLAASAKTVASMMTGAVAGAILNWLKNGKDVPSEKLISEISSVISAMMS